jgi:hypothetical protein
MCFWEQRGIADRSAQAEGIELCRQVSIPANRLRESGGADDPRVGDPVVNNRSLAGRGPLLEHRAGFRVNRRRIAPVLFIQLEHVPAVEPAELLPPCHIF